MTIPTPTPAPVAVAAPSVTYEDVVAAITPGEKTNATKIRSILGRGSNQTIQKYLDAYKQKQLQLAHPPVLPGPIPPAPPEMTALWGLAFTVANSAVSTRLDGVVQQRDMLAEQLSSAQEDVNSLNIDLDTKMDYIQAVDRDLANAKAMQEKAAQEWTAKAEKMTQEQEAKISEAAAQHAAELNRLKAEVSNLSHSNEMQKLEARLVEAGLNRTIDRLTDQLGELKSLLPRQAQAVEQPAPDASHKSPQEETGGSD